MATFYGLQKKRKIKAFDVEEKLNYQSLDLQKDEKYQNWTRSIHKQCDLGSLQSSENFTSFTLTFN